MLEEAMGQAGGSPEVRREDVGVTLPIANARGFSGYPELQEFVPGQCPGIYA